MLEQIEKATGRKRDGAGPLSRKEAARTSGLSERQSKTALRVARISELDFESAVDGDDPPTVRMN